MSNSAIRRIAAGVGLGVGAAALVLLLGLAGLLDVAELRTYDWRIARVADPASVHPDIVLVEINDASIRALAPLAGRWPWPRVLLADAVDFLARGRPRAIAIDLTIAEPDLREGFPYGGDKWSGAESDAALAQSIRDAGSVIMLGDVVYQGITGQGGTSPPDWPAAPYRLGPAIEERPTLTPPLPAIAQAVAAIGHNLLTPDHDGPARRMAPFIRVGDRYVPSLGVGTALVAGGFNPADIVLEGRSIRLGDREIPLVADRVPDWDDGSKTHEGLTMLINYKAPPLVNGARPYKSYEIRDLLASQEQIAAGLTPELDPAVFTDKVVFLGLTTSGLVDVFTTPYGSHSGSMPGIQLHASMADSILTNRFIRPAPERTRLATTAGFAVLVGLMATLLPYLAAAAGTLLLAGGWIWFSLDQFRDGLWLNLAQPVAACAVALAAVGRRVELDVVRATARGTAVADAPATFFARMRKFLGLTP